MNSNDTKLTFSQLFPQAGSPFCGTLPASGALFGDLLEFAGLPQWLVAFPWKTHFAFCGHHEPKVVVRAGADWDETILCGAGQEWAAESGVEPAASYWAYLFDELATHWPQQPRRGFDGLVSFPSEDGATSWPMQSLALVLATLAISDVTLDADVSRKDLLAVIEDLGIGMPYWSQAHAICALLGKADGLIRAGGRPDQIDTHMLDPELAVLAVPLRVAPIRRLSQLNECARFLVEQQIRAEFDPEYELNSIADLWFGPLCLRHDEVELLVEEAVRQPRFFDQLLGELKKNDMGTFDNGVQPMKGLLNYYVNMFRCVELAGDALHAGDENTLRGLAAEGIQRRNSLVVELQQNPVVDTALWQDLPGTGFSLCGCGSQQWLLGLIEAADEHTVRGKLEDRLQEQGILAGTGHVFRPHGAGGYDG